MRKDGGERVGVCADKAVDIRRSADQHIGEEVRALVHARGAHDALEIRRVDQQTHIAGDECVVKPVRDRLHFGKAGLVQIKIGQLRVGGAGKGAARLGHRLAQHLRQLAHALLVPRAFELFGRDAAGGAHQTQRILAHGLGLQDGLGVVIIVFQTEQLDQRLVGDKVFNLLEQRGAARRERGVYAGGVQTAHVLITAVAKQLGTVLKGLRLKHAGGAVGGEHLSFSRAQHGGEAEIRFFVH